MGQGPGDFFFGGPEIVEISMKNMENWGEHIGKNIYKVIKIVIIICNYHEMN